MKMYVVKYSRGDYDSYVENNIFVTSKKSTATKYVTKFNRILKYWHNYYRRYEGNTLGFSWLSDKHIEKHFRRWHCLKETNKCWREEIEVR